MSRKQNYGRKLFHFDNLYHLIDCMMLFGAQIEKLPTGSYRVSVKRCKKKWNTLGFLITVIESQDSLEFLSLRVQVVAGGHLVVRTRDSQFLGAAHKRWYPNGKLRMPDDVKIDEIALAFWLVGNWSETKMELPLMGRLLHKANITTPWVCYSTGGQEFLGICEDQRPQVEAWLAERMPDKFWRQSPVLEKRHSR